MSFFPASWLGLSDSEPPQVVADAIRGYQRLSGIAATGVADLTTYRRLYTDRILDGLESVHTPGRTATDAILIGGKRHPIDWPVVTPEEEGGLTLPSKCYGDSTAPKAKSWRRRRTVEELRAVVVHWDVCTSAAATRRVLEIGGISTHFVIDHDGTIYQLVDVLAHAWHAAGVNRYSVGVDFNCPVGIGKPDATNAKLRAKGQEARPVIEGCVVRGAPLRPFLGMHLVQLEAARALFRSLSRALPNLPLEVLSRDGDNILGLSRRKIEDVRGFLHHAEVDGCTGRKRSHKIDTAGVDLMDLVPLVRS